MKAGFSKLDITPPVGTLLMGRGIANDRACTAVHDPLFVRALWLEDGGREVLIAVFDVCFVAREDSDRWKGVLGRHFNLLPSQIMLAATHNHAGPAMGSYYDLEYRAPPRDYLRQVETALVAVASQARASRRDVTLRSGMVRSSLPMNRRCPRDGAIANAPNPAGPVLDSLPICLLEDGGGVPVCLLFSISTHVVCMRDERVSADFPGVAMDLLDAHLGATCSLFLQGCGGDSRPRLLGEGQRDWNWSSGWAEAQEIGQVLADEVLSGLEAGLTPAQPRLAAELVEMQWPFQPPVLDTCTDFVRAYELAEANPPGPALVRDCPYPTELYYLWAKRQLRLNQSNALPTHLPVLLQAVQLGEGIRLVAIEGEPVAAHGHAVERAFAEGTTFALGYANGEAVYLVTSEMLDEGGYETDSYWEFGYPAPLAAGMEEILESALRQLHGRGIR